MGQRLDAHSESKLLVGCAGWSVPGAQRAHFPEAGSHLARYAAVLPAVEINSSFYRPHKPETYRRWRESVPDNFRFSVKVPRTITHEHRLQNTDELLARFLQEVEELREKLACLLVQLPPSLGFHRRSVEAFFERLRKQTAAPVVCEARHRSWFSAEAEEALAALGIARVIADPAVAPVAVKGQTVYVRLHGSPEMYHSAYTEDFLDKLAEELKSYRAEGKTAWCIFDNTASGAAMPNALSLLERVSQEVALNADVKD